MMNAAVNIILLIAFIVAATPAGAVDQAKNQDAAPAAEAGAQDNWSNLDVLVSTINAKRRELAAKRRELVASRDDLESERLKKEIEQISLDLDSLQTAWEMLATGGADLGLFGVKTETAFNWRTELQSVFEPILVELKRLTERPRKIERLRGDQNFYQRRLDVAEEALQNITQYREKAPSPSLKAAFGGLEDRWRKRRDDLKNHLQLVNFELQEMFAPSKQSQRDPVQALKELLSGRVLNLLIAALVMMVVYLLLRGAAQIYSRVRLRKSRRRTIMARATGLLLYLSTTLLVLLSGMAVFYVQGDWLLLGLFIIVLAGAAWAIQKSLPHYIVEAKLMLNLGPVREGERLIYNDLPWLVKSLNFYTTLVNPQLDGGTLRIPVRELVGYNSREYSADEPWFPTRSGDFVVLDDGSYGKVLAQTPELVQLTVLGATKTYRATAFVDQKPRNLSRQGFTLVLTFGLDYQHQERITTDIRYTLEQELVSGMRRADVAQLLTGLTVEFSQAASSSLDFVIIANFNGEAADRFYKIQRLLQGLAVDACNKHHWVIPFTQVTLHQA